MILFTGVRESEKTYYNDQDFADKPLSFGRVFSTYSIAAVFFRKWYHCPQCIANTVYTVQRTYANVQLSKMQSGEVLCIIYDTLYNTKCLQ